MPTTDPMQRLRSLVDRRTRSTACTDLEFRIRAMAERWDYYGDELDDALSRAVGDFEGWRRAVEHDEDLAGMAPLIDTQEVSR